MGHSGFDSGLPHCCATQFWTVPTKIQERQAESECPSTKSSASHVCNTQFEPGGAKRNSIHIPFQWDLGRKVLPPPNSQQGPGPELHVTHWRLRFFWPRKWRATADLVPSRGSFKRVFCSRVVSSCGKTAEWPFGSSFGNSRQVPLGFTCDRHTLASLFVIAKGFVVPRRFEGRRCSVGRRGVLGPVPQTTVLQPFSNLPQT